MKITRVVECIIDFIKNKNCHIWKDYIKLDYETWHSEIRGIVESNVIKITNEYISKNYVGVINPGGHYIRYLLRFLEARSRKEFIKSYFFKSYLKTFPFRVEQDYYLDEETNNIADYDYKYERLLQSRAVQEFINNECTPNDYIPVLEANNLMDYILGRCSEREKELIEFLDKQKFINTTLTYEDYARDKNISVDSVKKRVERLKKKVRLEINQYNYLTGSGIYIKRPEVYPRSDNILPLKKPDKYNIQVEYNYKVRKSMQINWKKILEIA